MLPWREPATARFSHYMVNTRARNHHAELRATHRCHRRVCRRCSRGRSDIVEYAPIVCRRAARAGLGRRLERQHPRARRHVGNRTRVRVRFGEVRRRIRRGRAPVACEEPCAATISVRRANLRMAATGPLLRVVIDGASPLGRRDGIVSRQCAGQSTRHVQLARRGRLRVSTRAVHQRHEGGAARWTAHGGEYGQEQRRSAITWRRPRDSTSSSESRDTCLSCPACGSRHFHRCSTTAASRRACSWRDQRSPCAGDSEPRPSVGKTNST